MNTPGRAPRRLKLGWCLAAIPACAQTISAGGDSTVDAGHDLGSPVLVDVHLPDTTAEVATAADGTASADAAVPCDTPACRQQALDLHVARSRAMIRLADGRTLGWGHDEGLAMGQGDFRLGPRAVAIPAASHLYIGTFVDCRIDPDHSLWCWGTDGLALTYTNTRPSRRGPETARRVMSEVRDVAVRNAALCAVRLSGHVDCIGNNAGWAVDAELADSLLSTAVPALGVSGVTRMSEGIDTTETFCALSDRATYCWGPVPHALFWRGAPSGSTPQLLPAWQGATRLVAAVLSCSLDLRGALGCAGGRVDAVTGALQREPSVWARTRVEMQGVPRMTDLTIGGSLCTVDVDGRVWCGGYNELGQSGVGSTEAWASFQPVSLPEAAEQVRCGATFCCARTRSGQVWCWGDNREGQLGRPSTTLERSLVPIRVTWD